MKKTIIALAALTSIAGAGAAAAQGASFADIDADQNGEISYSEITAIVPNMTMDDFSAADADGNGSLSEAEFEALAAKSGG